MQNVVNLKTDRVLLDNSIVEHANQLIEKYGNVEFELIVKLGTDGECFPLICKIIGIELSVDSRSMITGKSLSETLLFAEHGENLLCTKIVLSFRNSFCTQDVLPRFELGFFMY